MIALLRLAVFGLVIMTGAYFLLAIYSRSVRREALEKEWDADHAEGGEAAARDAYIEAGMAAYEKSLRKKLIFLVFVLPVIAVLVILYLTNY